MAALLDKRKRLFFALWPDDSVREKCMGIAQGINPRTVNVVASANLHLTLLYLGYVSAEQEMAIKQAAATITIPKITLCFNRLSFWKSPEVLCLTTTNIGQDIIRLVSDLVDAAKELDIVTDRHPYNPHITLAKKVKDAWTQDFEPIVWNAESYCLVESIADMKKTEYRIIEKWGISK